MKRDFLLLATFALLLQACSKSDVADETPPFVFAASVDDIEMGSGRYVTDFPVDSSHYVTMPVDVSHTGAWFYQTDAINGVWFEGSGSFTDTGRQSIRLQARGIPQKGGIITVPVSDGNATRTFSIAFLDAYFKVNFSGEQHAVDCYPGSDYRFLSSAQPDTADGLDRVTPTFTILLDKDYENGLYFAVRKREFLADAVPSLQGQADFLAPGVYDYWRWGSDRSGFDLTFGKRFDSLHLSFIIDNFAQNEKVEILQTVQVNNRSHSFPDLDFPYFKLKIHFRCNVTTFHLNTGTLEGEAVIVYRAI